MPKCETSKIIIHKCYNNPPQPTEIDIDTLVPPKIDFKGFYSEKPNGEKGSDVIDHDRDILISFCEAMLENLSSEPHRTFFADILKDLQSKDV